MASSGLDLYPLRDEVPETGLQSPPPEFRRRQLTLVQEARLLRWCDPSRSINIAAELSESLLGQIGMLVCDELQIDRRSGDDWQEKAVRALDYCMQKAPPKSTPWPGASNVIYPLISEAATQFHARAYPAIIANRSVVRAAILGEDTGTPKLDPSGSPVIDPQTSTPVFADNQKPGDKTARSTRVAEHMSYQLLTEMEEWEAETDKLLAILPVVGCEFRKTYYDHELHRPTSLRVPASNLIINYMARSLDTAPRISELFERYPYEISERVANGTYVPGDYGADLTSSLDSQAPRKFVEQHRRIDLDGDGYPEPYIVIVHIDSQKVARITANFEADGIRKDGSGSLLGIDAVKYYTQYDFLPNMEGGIYGMGWAHYLFSINESINTTLNMMFDAGHLQNAGGGFIGKGLTLHSGKILFRPGEYKMVNALGSNIRDSIVNFEHRGPAQALFSLLELLISAGKDISAVKDILTGELKAQTMSPTVLQSIIEQGLKVFTAIYKRVHRSLKREVAKIYRLNSIHLPDIMQFSVQDVVKVVKRSDYTIGAGVEPITDPSMVVDAQKLAKSQMLAEMKDDPLVDGIEIRRRMLEAASIEKPETILKSNPSPNPELLVRTGELEIKRMLAKAEAAERYAVAIKNLAEADEKIAEPFVQWMMLQLKVLENEANTAGSAGAEQGTNGLAPASSGADGNPTLPA